ncbi:MAG: AI-2E family transporter [Bdellovibrionales bacterium]|nr:AI-2E family transporter [Bdellovibrionales bacterium]
MNITKKQIANNILLACVFAGFGYLLLPFIMPLMLAVIFAFVLEPLHQKMSAKYMGEKISAFIIVIFFTFIILGPSITLIVRGSEALLEFLKNREVNELSFIERLIINFDFLGLSGAQLTRLIGIVAQNIGGFTLKLIQNFLQKAPQIGLSMVLVLVSVYFFLAEKQKVQFFVKKYTPFTKEKLEKLIKALRLSSKTVIQTNVIGGLFQAFIFSLSALILGTDKIFLIGFSVFLLSFIPIVGTAPVSITLALFYFFTDKMWLGTGWLVAGIIAGISDNIVKSFIIRAGVKIHPFIAFLMVLGGMIMLGMPGLFLGPLLAGLFVTWVPILLDLNYGEKK